MIGTGETEEGAIAGGESVKFGDVTTAIGDTGWYGRMTSPEWEDPGTDVDAISDRVFPRKIAKVATDIIYNSYATCDVIRGGAGIASHETVG